MQTNDYTKVSFSCLLSKKTPFVSNKKRQKISPPPLLFEQGCYLLTSILAEIRISLPTHSFRLNNHQIRTVGDVSSCVVGKVPSKCFGISAACFKYHITEIVENLQGYLCGFGSYYADFCDVA
jgi:hypothetical protein